MNMKPSTLAFILLFVLVGTACRQESSSPSTPSGDSRTTAPATAIPLRGASGYTPYDWCSLLWAQSGGEMVWVNSGAEAGKLLVSKADPAHRPDWAFCSQGVVAGLSARGEEPVIIATLYISGDAVRPVLRKPRTPLRGSRSLFIPRSSIEVAFDRFLAREGVNVADVSIPRVENPTFTTIVSLLGKPASASDSIDFGILVEPFISNLFAEHPNDYELGAGGLYELCYSLVVRRDDLEKRRNEFVSLLKQFDALSKKVEAYTAEVDFYANVWGRKKNGTPETLPRLVSFDYRPARLLLQPERLRGLLREELSVLVKKYPNELRMPKNVSLLVDESLLKEVVPARVTP